MHKKMSYKIITTGISKPKIHKLKNIAVHLIFNLFQYNPGDCVILFFSVEEFRDFHELVGNKLFSICLGKELGI